MIRRILLAIIVAKVISRDEAGDSVGLWLGSKEQGRGTDEEHDRKTSVTTLLEGQKGSSESFHLKTGTGEK